MRILLVHTTALLFALGVLVSPLANYAAAPSARETLTAQLLAWLLQEEGIPGSDVVVSELDGRVRVPECANGFDFGFPFNDKSTVRVTCSSPSWSIVTRVTFPRAAQSAPELATNQQGIITYALTAARPAGHIISAADVQQLTVPSQTGRSGGRHLTLAQITGARLARDMPAATALQVGDIQIAHRVLTVSAPLQRGSALTEANTQMMTFYGSPPADVATSLNDLRRMVASTQLRPNQPIRLSSLRQLADVIRGDELMLSVRRGPVTIETAVIALSQGIIGEQIEVRSTDSGETFRVVITGVGRAEPR